MKQDKKTEKEAVIPFLGPLMRFLDRLGVHPNALTVMGGLITLVAAWLYATQDTLWPGALVMLLGGLFDTLDGQLAKQCNKKTDFGALLDSSMDRFSEFAIFAGLMWHFREQAWVLLVLFLGLVPSILISYIRARGEGLLKSTPDEVKAGPMSRAFRYFWVIIASFFPEFGFVVAMIGFDVACWITVARRCAKLYTLLSTKERAFDKGERRFK